MAPKRHAASSGTSNQSSSAAGPASTSTSSSGSKISSGPPTLKSNASAQEIVLHIWHQYLASTPQRTLLLDAFMAFLFLVGVVQFVYCVLAGNYVSLSLIIALVICFMGM